MNGLVPMDLDEEDKYLVTRDCRKAIVAAIKYKNLVVSSIMFGFLFVNFIQTSRLIL